MTIENIHMFKYTRDQIKLIHLIYSVVRYRRYRCVILNRVREFHTPMAIAHIQVIKYVIHIMQNCHIVH